MADQRGKPVEKWRLTPEQMRFSKNFRNVLQIKKLLDAKTLNVKAQVDNLRELWQGYGKGMQLMWESKPKESFHDLPGMDFGEEREAPLEGKAEDFRLNW